MFLSKNKIRPGALAEKTGVSRPAISDWVKSAVHKGLITWCDENGEEFDDINALDKAKYSGKGYVRLIIGKSLPTPYELTGDPRWDKGGDLYALYDLYLDAEGPVDEGLVHWGVRLVPNDNQADDEFSESCGFVDEVPDKAVMH